MPWMPSLVKKALLHVQTTLGGQQLQQHRTCYTSPLNSHPSRTEDMGMYLLVEFVYLVFTRMPGESCSMCLRSFVVVFLGHSLTAMINSLHSLILRLHEGSEFQPGAMCLVLFGSNTSHPYEGVPLSLIHISEPTRPP